MLSNNNHRGNNIGGDESDGSDDEFPSRAASNYVGGDFYDEFGNYRGAELSSDEEDLDNTQNRGIISIDDSSISKPSSVVLHEDKEYYPTAEEIYGEGVDVMVEDEDRQPLEKPIIEPVKSTTWNLVEKEYNEAQPVNFSWEYLLELMKIPSSIRNISIVGHLHHGKTSFVDQLVRFTHNNYRDYQLDKDLNYTDIRPDEHRRGLSIKSSPMTLLLESTKQKSYLVNIMDTPGHINFSDELTASMRISDGIVLVVDALEGVMSNTVEIIKQAVQERLPIVLLINKLDRLILELKLPPNDTYHKLKHTISEVNNILKNTIHDESLKDSYNIKEANSNEFPTTILSPDIGNVCFASSKTGVCFTLESFAKIYADQKKNFNYKEFAKRLWGDLYFDRSTRGFSKNPNELSKRSFVEFILEPLYKIYSHIVGQDPEELDGTLRKISVKLNSQELALDPNPLMKCTFRALFNSPSGFVDMLERYIPAPSSSYGGNKTKVENFYTGTLDTKTAKDMINCDSNGDLVIYITKLFPRPDYSSFDVFGRVMSGTLKKGDAVKILGEGYTPSDEEDMSITDVSNLYIYNSRYRINVDSVSAGNWVLIEGIDATISKTSTLYKSTASSNTFIFKPLTYMNQSVMKIAVEPLKPSELPKMMEGLRKINKSFPLVTTKVEESGEHILLGTGELYLDIVMHDLRTLYSGIEIKVSDPSVTFCETVAETSSVRCSSQTPNNKNQLVMVAQPLERGLTQDIESGRINLDKMGSTVREDIMKTKYGWDEYTTSRIWSFGPEVNGPNALINETFEGEVDQKLLSTVKDSIVQGFRWSTKEGPLCEEPIRNVKFRLLEASISEDRIARTGGQIIPTTRRVCYSSFLSATPQLMEPISLVEIQSPLETLEIVHKILERRRGHVIEDEPKPGTPHYILKAYVPAIDSFGLETDMRLSTKGRSFCLSKFDHWDIVPGDPLDTSITIAPLEPSPLHALAREFLLKTRRRKGLSDEINFN
ncbi:predicted protein [Naegleria gruberi]|uniref:116 kDa U5 small nuclear ribonucleoprotein component n=1 Tax=Naegleria gruberi TaxID=5762 RepID=D2VA51_NAEGR|nr:uncharacterized protein NAEGRDRAFT_32369 [Naegleria gruberi]EFC46247.1 predicted protein [Naegleria gruberi]|eukprot:XP_002678991.1 predicted protein [Naegleria gruberi strain NEG-M]